MTAHELPSSARRPLHRVANLDTTGEYSESAEGREVVADLAEANVVSSLIPRPAGSLPTHRPVLDLDVPAFLVPSSTPGHSHLYIDQDVPDAEFWRLCDALAEAGILQEGYVSASKSRGYTSVRLPWVKKPEASA